MESVYTFYACQEASATTQSNIISNAKGENLTLSVSGNATGLAISLWGVVDAANLDNFYKISGINLGDFSVVTDIGANGVYQFSIEGLSKLYIAITAITGGTVTAFARITKGA